MPRPLVGDDPMPASSGLGTSPTGGSELLAPRDSSGMAARQAEADEFFARHRDAQGLALLHGERKADDLPPIPEPASTHAQTSQEPAGDTPPPSELLATWRRDCERARAVDAHARGDVIAHERAESNRARSESARMRRDLTRNREARRRAELARVATWQREHPDRARATKDRWIQNNLEKRRKASRDYYYRNKETILAKAKERHEADPAVRQKRQQKYRQSHPDRIAAASAAWRSKPESKLRHQEATKRWEQREQRRRDVGLPPRRIHRRTPGDKQLDACNADAFFGRDWSRIRISDEPEHRLDPTPPEMLDEWEKGCARARLRHRLRNDPAYRERIEHHREALQDHLRSQVRRLAAQARIDAVARAVNDRLRTAPRRQDSADHAAPHRLPSAPTRSLLGR